MAKAACIDIDVAHRQTAMIVAIRLEEFKIPRVICHSHLAAKLRRTSRRCVQRFGERALETKQRTPTRHANIHNLARGIGKLIDTEVSRQLRDMLWCQRYPGFVETDWHGMCSLSETALSIFIVKFEDLPSTSLVQCHLQYPIVTTTDVEQDIVSFD
jgi:hypothetical protein